MPLFRKYTRALTFEKFAKMDEATGAEAVVKVRRAVECVGWVKQYKVAEAVVERGGRVREEETIQKNCLTGRKFHGRCESLERLVFFFFTPV